VEVDDVLGVIEDLFTGMSQTLTTKQVPTPFQRLTYRDSMTLYGTDKPDLRYGLPSIDVSDVFSQTEFAVFRDVVGSGGAIRGIAVPGGAKYSRREIDELTEIAKTQGARGLAWAAIEADGLRSSFARFLSEGEKAAMSELLGASTGDLILL